MRTMGGRGGWKRKRVETEGEEGRLGKWGRGRAGQEGRPFGPHAQR